MLTVAGVVTSLTSCQHSAEQLIMANSPAAALGQAVVRLTYYVVQRLSLLTPMRAATSCAAVLIDVRTVLTHIPCFKNNTTENPERSQWTFVQFRQRHQGGNNEGQGSPCVVLSTRFRSLSLFARQKPSVRQSKRWSCIKWTQAFAGTHFI